MAAKNLFSVFAKALFGKKHKFVSAGSIGVMRLMGYGAQSTGRSFQLFLAFALGGFSLGAQGLVACAQDSPKIPPVQPAQISVGLVPLDGDQEKGGAAASSAFGRPVPSETSDPSSEAIDAFVQSLNGTKLIGRFTVLGKDQDELPTEEYTISKCERLPQPGMIRMTARIKYGDVDVELPLDLPVKWAGDTPVISLTNLWLPGLGTFSSRVLFYQNSYAGTWQHGDVGGHLFGVIVRIPKSEEAASAKQSNPAAGKK